MAVTPRVTRPDQVSERRTQILAIAAKLIASRGYSATTVRDIADEAGILSGSLYHHFSSKEAILQEVLREFLDELVSRFEEIAATGGGPRVVLDRLIEHAFSAIERQPDAVGLYQNEAAFLSTQPGFEFVAERGHRVEEIWVEQITAGQASGVFRSSMDPAIVYRFVRDALWSTIRWFRPGGHHTAASVSLHFLDFLHNGLLVD
ncbi:TetR/AcrR family transcriptional regulator [uncultured Microbacterium sp.]|uniref:TetR/AcrR family transcriptional regulator n=1 Tax=uncultured Microbacterium sp. TaxID=191216 RepID=UPI0035CC7184